MQHFQFKRFDYIIVRAIPEAGHNVGSVSPDGEENDGQLLPVLPDPPAQPVPMAVRHVPVQQHKSGYMMAQCLPGLGKGGADGYPEGFLLQVFLYGSRDVRIVFDIV